MVAFGPLHVGGMIVITPSNRIHIMEHWGEVRVCILVAEQNAKYVGQWPGKYWGRTGARISVHSVDQDIVGLEQGRGWEIFCPERRWAGKFHSLEPAFRCERVQSE